jgi:hypothetical protein
MPVLKRFWIISAMLCGQLNGEIPAVARAFYLLRISSITVAALGAGGEVAFIAPNAHCLRHGQANQVLDRDFLALGQLLGLLEDRLRYFGFDCRHKISRNFNNICAGVTP